MQRDSHILKIVNNGRTFDPNKGVKCYPRQTYGVSQEAPDHLKGPYSITAQNGYLFKYDDEEERNPQQPFSQRKYCSVVGYTIDVVEDFRQKYDKGAQNPVTFRRRKGRLTQFMDKNGWMNKVVKIMGFERSNQAREASNKDRQARINSLTVRKYNNPVALKPLPKQNFAAMTLYTEKAKIRTQRYSLRKGKQDSLDIQRSLQARTPNEEHQHNKKIYLQAQSMTNKMASTLNDKDWRSTMSSIRKKHSPNKRNIRLNATIDSSRQMSLTCEDWSKNNGITCKKVQQPKDEIKEWFNTTCNSGADFWKFRKPRKMDSENSQQMNWHEK